MIEIYKLSDKTGECFYSVRPCYVYLTKGECHKRDCTFSHDYDIITDINRYYCKYMNRCKMFKPNKKCWYIHNNNKRKHFESLIRLFVNKFRAKTFLDENKLLLMSENEVSPRRSPVRRSRRRSRSRSRSRSRTRTMSPERTSRSSVRHSRVLLKELREQLITSKKKQK